LTEIEAIQREERRNGEQVMQLARTQSARELENAAKALAPLEGSESAGLDGGQLTAKADGAAVVGKLERAEPDTLIIRDESGFEYWLRASDSTHVTFNGRPARLTEFKQGAQVRASFAWEGNQRVATEVEVLDAGQPLDGGQPTDGGA
jgi:colicin import membrane protein